MLDDANEGIVESDRFVPFNPERPIEQRQYDIGDDVGISSTRQLSEQSSVRLPDNDYLKLVASLIIKQREFFNHVMQWIKCKKEPLYAFLSGGAGFGKSVLIKALYQALHRYLCSNEGENPDDTRILLCAYTGKHWWSVATTIEITTTIEIIIISIIFQPKKHFPHWLRLYFFICSFSF